MKMKIVGISIAAVIGIIMLGSVLVPILEQATDTETTITNDGARYSLWESGAHTITFTSTSMLTDGVEQSLPDTSAYGSATLAYGTGGIARYYTNGHIYWWGNVSGSGTQRDMGLAENVSIVITDAGVGTVESTTATTRDLGTVEMYAEPTGVLSLSLNPYVLSDSTIYGSGTTTVSEVSYGISWGGTVDGEITVSAIIPPEQTFGDVVVNTSSVETNLLKVDSVVIPNTTADADFTYTYFFAPYEITYDNPGYVGEQSVDILAAIPIMIIVAILLGVVALVVRSKNE